MNTFTGPSLCAQAHLRIAASEDSTPRAEQHTKAAIIASKGKHNKYVKYCKKLGLAVFDTVWHGEIKRLKRIS